jgi:lipopolysaccharide/colanic/teichoic acid biosynthesis glycosyltransferase
LHAATDRAEAGTTEVSVLPEPVLKRAFDILLSLAGIILSLPVTLLFALAIVVEERGPIFYTHDRVGRGGRVFKFYKFRTMRIDADRMPAPPDGAAHDPRVTFVGRILRRTAMNELPQILNILKGDMSFVGPRPDVVPAVEKLRKELPGYDRRHAVRPGLTGVSQLEASRWAPERVKLHYDLFYVRKRSFRLDLALIARSVVRTLRGGWDT